MDPSDATPPSIDLTAPSDGHEITAPTEIMAEIDDTQLDLWVVEYRRVESTDWIRLAEGDEPVSGVLTVFDPTLLKNGLYEIRVRAEDKIGNADSAYLTAFVDGQLKVGLNQVAFTDLRVPVSGINITVIRAYNAGDKRSKDFGHGWSAAVRDLDLMESRAMGDGWYEENVGSFLPQWEIQADEVHLVVVIWPDGRSEAFDMRAEYTDPVYRTGAEVQISFVPREGTTSTLEPVNSQLLLYNAGEIIGSDDLDPFDPDERSIKDTH